MKKKFLSIVLSFAMVAAMIPAMSITASADVYSPDCNWTTIGKSDCQYMIKTDGKEVTLTIAPKNGRHGTLPDGYEASANWPWSNEASGACGCITKVKFIGNVKAGNSTSFMFYAFNKLTEIEGLNKLDTKNVEDMSNMFCDSYSLSSLDVSGFDTRNVEDMFCMFYNCNSLTKLDLSTFNTRNVENMASMFSFCNSLTDLNISNFDTSKVKKMFCMFYNCNSLTKLDLSTFDTRNVENMDCMFYFCKSLTKLDLSTFDTRNVTSMAEMFYNCQALKTIYVSDKFSTEKVVEENSSKDMFDSCEKLVGGEGTAYSDQSLKDKTYARIDDGESNPGYFTKASKVKQFFTYVNNNIQRVVFVIKTYFNRLNRIFFNGNLVLPSLLLRAA